MSPFKLAIAIALLLVSGACLGNSPARMAMDASEIRAQFPQLFRVGPGNGETAKTPAKDSWASRPGDVTARFATAPGAPRRQQELRGACERSESAFCYDVAERRAVYRPARELMPRLQGLRAESVSLHRQEIRFKYSFR
jgi:hypothetical protein